MALGDIRYVMINGERVLQQRREVEVLVRVNDQDGNDASYTNGVYPNWVTVPLIEPLNDDELSIVIEQIEPGYVPPEV